MAVLGDCLDTNDQLLRAADDFHTGLADSPALGSGSAHVVWRDERRTIVAGDVAGARPIFYIRRGHAVVFASDAAPLGDLIGHGPDPNWVALNLACPELSGEAGRSPFTNVRMVPAGHALVIDDRGVSYRPDARLATPADDLIGGAPRLRDALTHSVASRVQTGRRVTADLSGGLDSSSIVALARHSGRSGIFSLTLDSGQPDNDDLAHATTIAESLTGLNHVVRTIPDDVLPYTGLDTVPVTDEPIPDVAVYARTQWWQQQLADLRGDIHLVGDGGDAVLVATPAYLADLAATGQVSELLRSTAHWARLGRASAARIALAAARVAATPRYAAIHTLAKRIQAPRSGTVRPAIHDLIGWFPPPTGADWLTADARKSAASLARSQYDARDVADWPAGDQVALRALRAFGRTHRTDRQLANHDGINLAAPFLDDAVVRACLAVPARIRTSTTAAKPLLRAALRGSVPEPVLHRSTKGDYTELHYRGLARNASNLRELVDDLHLARTGIVDPLAVRRTVEQGVLGQRVRIGVLDSIIAAELWLRAHHHRTPTQWDDLREEVRDDQPLPIVAARVTDPHS